MGFFRVLLKIPIWKTIIKVVKDISANFILLNGIVVVLLVMYVIWRRPARRRRPKLLDPPQSSTPKGLKALAEELKAMGDKPVKIIENPDQPAPVIFNWNGHSWDAYEVLGIPPGSTRIEINNAFKEEIAKMDEESQAFIRKAYETLMQSLNSR